MNPNNSQKHKDPHDFVLEVMFDEQPFFATLKIDAIWNGGFLEEFEWSIKDLRDAQDHPVKPTQDMLLRIEETVEDNNDEIVEHIYEQQVGK